jgi:hypothetical protein
MKTLLAALAALVFAPAVFAQSISTDNLALSLQPNSAKAIAEAFSLIDSAAGPLVLHKYQTTTAQCTGFTAANDTLFCNPTAAAAADATETNRDVAWPASGLIYAISCGLSVAPANGANTQTRTLAVSIGTTPTTVTCTIPEAEKTCTGRVAAGVAVVGGDLVSIKHTAAQTPAAAEGTCSIVWVRS